MEKKIKINYEILSDELIVEMCNIQDQNQILVSPNLLNEYLNNSSTVILTATCDNKLIGFIIAKNLIDFLDFDYIFVNKNFRRNNVASMLINSIESFCFKTNIPKILLEVRKSNKIALSLYLKNNFKQIHTRKNYYSSPLEDAIILEKKIL